MITGATRLAGVIGDPVRHSLSPTLHNAAYAALDLDWVYLAFEVEAGRTRDALDAMRALHLVGLSVTMPHKTDAARLCDELSDAARALQSVNTVTRLEGGGLHGDSTDADGFLRALDDGRVTPDGARALVIGAGGAARSVALALAAAGAEVTITARRADAAAAAAELAGASTVPWSDRDDVAATTDIIVNATPVGMGDGLLPLAVEALTPEHTVVDLVYHPLETPLLAAARTAGMATVDGLGMLVHQAALQVERWTGQPAPITEMRTAAREALPASA